MKLIYVHGRAQEGKDPVRLQADEWDAGLAKGLSDAHLAWPAGVEARLPFYGNTLASLTAQVDSDEANGLIARGDGERGDDDYRAFTEAWVAEVARASGVDPNQVHDSSGDPVARGLANWKYINALIRKLNDVRPLAEFSIDAFTHDVFVYLRYQKVSVPVEDIVDGAIPTDEPCVVLAHSLGTVVAYKVLRARSDRRNVRAFITVGSPLGVRAVVEKMAWSGQANRAPGGIRRWYNARDPLDVVALHEVNAQDFPGTPEVENGSHVKNGSENKHRIFEYLSDEKVARAVHAALAGGG